MPSSVDLREPGGCYPYPDVVDQGGEVACVTVSFLTALYCARVRRGLRSFPASGAPALNGSRIHSASIAASTAPRVGATFADVMKELRRSYGEDLAEMRVEFLALRSDDVEKMREHLSLGHILVAGYKVNAEIHRFHEDAAFCAARGFVLPDFSKDARRVSGHTVLLLGYRDSSQSFLARNSWGPTWGDGGHFYVPYRSVSRGCMGDVVAVV
jgi:hypothetical protein